jgi:ribosomal protein S18 acetylase RimI-like enzyme
MNSTRGKTSRISGAKKRYTLARSLWNMTIRPLRATEVDRLIVLWKEFMNDPSAIDQAIPTHDENVRRETESLNKLIQEDPKQVLVADEDGDLIGYLIFLRQAKTPLQMRHSHSFITDLYVRPSYRRRGIGMKLLQACFDDVQSSGTAHVRLAVWSKNESAIRLYRQVGFKDYMLMMETEIPTKA